LFLNPSENLHDCDVKTFESWKIVSYSKIVSHFELSVTIEHSNRCIAAFHFAMIHSNCSDSWNKMQN